MQFIISAVLCYYNENSVRLFIQQHYIIQYATHKNMSNLIKSYKICTCLCSLVFGWSDYKSEPAIAAMHGPHSVFDIGHCTVIHCDAGGASLVDQ